MHAIVGVAAGGWSDSRGWAMTRLPTVTVAIPVLNEERHLRECLDSVLAQTYRGQIEILVIDGGSSDATRAIAATYPAVRLLENPRRTQSAGLNIALAAAGGEVFQRVDGHSTIARDFVACSVETLQQTGAPMVGAAVRPRSTGRWIERAMAVATVSPFGAGPAPYRLGGPSRWVDTVFLPSFWTASGRERGGYDEDRVNEDAEFAYRMGDGHGVWYEERLESTYVPRDTLRGIASQYYRYGRLRPGMLRRHPRSVSARHLVAPLFLVGLLSPWRRSVLSAYAVLLGGVACRELPHDPGASAGIILTLPCMHLPWALGFFASLLRPATPERRRVHDSPRSWERQSELAANTLETSLANSEDGGVVGTPRNQAAVADAVASAATPERGRGENIRPSL
jgi:succinoglycan biosynthesis protein ExoA